MGCFFYAPPFIILIISADGKTPDFLEISFPERYNIKVGTPLMFNFSASAGFLSTSIFIILTVSPSDDFTCSKMGASVLQGPHQVA